ncbi:hypothetical protein QTP70_013048 [Hemibagrus guttatus]|uniref:Uncharacterized protein n=1 Tax=Hemibagrus guttatus TaxID=175788 RepID=A0AAE0R2J6_9TELE|nr:hypothetical protein QTP70_013048 [Hemibagrus guttatus]
MSSSSSLVKLIKFEKQKTGKTNKNKTNTGELHTEAAICGAIVIDRYEEDFEADDEGPMDDGIYEGNETSPSLSREEEDERRKNENGNEDLKRNKVRGSSSISSDLSSNEEDEEEFEEEHKKEELKPKRHKNAEETEILQASSISQLTKDETPNPEMEHTEREDGEAEEPIEEPREAEECKDDTGEAKEPRDEPGKDEEPKGETGEPEESGEVEEPRDEPGEAEEPGGEPGETEGPGEAQKAREDLREGRAINVNKEAEQAKSVQEKFAEAFLMTECVSEPELSDSTTEEDELVSVEIQQLGPVPGDEPESNVAQQTTDQENGAEHVLKAQREEAHAEEPKEEPETQEAPQPDKDKEKEKDKEKDTNQTEGKSQNTTNEDKHLQDKQNNGDDTNEDQKLEIKSDRTDEEEEQKQGDNNFTNEENKSNEEAERMEKSEDKEPQDEEVPKPEKETMNKNSVNSAETRATSVDEEVSMMEETTALLPENPEETSVNHVNMEQNTELGKRLCGEHVCAEDQVTEVRADEEEIFADESRNLRNNAEETGNDVTRCVEGNIEKRELKIKLFSVNEVKDKDVTGEGEKSEETVEVPETEGEKEQLEDGDETEVRNEVEEDQEELTDEGNNEKNINQEMTEDREAQTEATSTGQTSEDKTEDDVGEREEELTAEKDVELKGDQTSVSECNDTEDKKHEEELKQNESLKENELEGMSEGGEEMIEVGGADSEMQKLVMKQEDDNKEEQNDNSASSVHEDLQETNDGPEVKPGGIKAENGEEIITIDQEELDEKEAAGPGDGEGWSETNEEEINGDMVEESLKEEQINEDNEKEEEDQREIHQETTNEEEEEQEVSEEEFEQKQNIQQETTNEEDVKDEQKNEMRKIKPLISENNNNAATEDEASSEAKTPAEDPAGAESEPKATNVDLKVEESRGGAGNHIQSSTDTKKNESTNAAEESRSVEGSISPSEGSQKLEKGLVIKREERGATLIVAPQIDQEELVSNWVNVHKASNYFETFVEPLDEIKILDRERTGNAEDLETNKSKEFPRNEESSENAKGEQISLLEISEREELEDTMVESFNMETEALAVEGRRNPSSRNPSEEEENQTQIYSEQAPEDQEDVAISEVMNISATPLMKTEISQDS